MAAREYIFDDGRSLSVRTMYCIGRNYAAHAREMNAEVPTNPIVFLKTETAYVAPGEDLHIPEYTSNMQHEVELVVVIGEDADNLRIDEASKVIAGYAVGLGFDLARPAKRGKAARGAVDTE